MRLRALAKDVFDEFRRNGLPNFTSAIAFQILFAIVPFLLLVLALLAFLQLEEVWRDHVRPELRENVSTPAFQLTDDTVEQVLAERQAWWLSAGLALTLWQLSSAARIVMTALDRVYGYRRRRGLVELLPRSIVLGAAMGASAVAALAIVRFGPLVIGDVDGALP